MRNIEENRHLTKDRARLGCGGDLKIALQHFDLSLDENIENALLLLLDQEHFTGAEGPFRKPLAITQNCAHLRTSARRQNSTNGDENRYEMHVRPCDAEIYISGFIAEAHVQSSMFK